MVDISTGWHVGHKGILRFTSRQFGITTWRTIIAWRKKGMPFHRLWNGKPYVIEQEVLKWQIKRRD